MSSKKISDISSANLYNCIVKLVNIYESKLDFIIEESDLDSGRTQKQINSILNYLVKLITQLNKLNKDFVHRPEGEDISAKDQEIIDRFLARFKK